MQSSLNQKQRLQQLFFPEGVRFDGKRLVGTGLTLPVFNYLAVTEDSKKELVDLSSLDSNRVRSWLRQLDGLRAATNRESD